MRRYVSAHLTVPSPSPILILCEDRDPIARRASGELAQHCGTEVEVCTASDLLEASYFLPARSPATGPGESSPRYAGQPAADPTPLVLPGEPRVLPGEPLVLPGEIVLRDGRLLFQDRLKGLWNRLEAWPAALAGQSQGAGEALASWILGARCPLLGEPGIHAPQQSTGWSHLHWAREASRAGLQVPVVEHRAGALPRRPVAPLGERASVLVTGKVTSAIGPLAEELAPNTLDACVRLARSVSPLLEVRLVPHGQSGWHFAEANPIPDPFPHGRAGIANLASLFGVPLAGQPSSQSKASIQLRSLEGTG